MNAVELAAFERLHTDDFDMACTVRRFLRPSLEKHFPPGYVYSSLTLWHCERDAASAIFDAVAAGTVAEGTYVRFHRATERTWLRRALLRDGGKGAWETLELYLPCHGGAWADEDAYRLFQSSDYDRTHLLRELLTRVARPNAPTCEELRLIWFNAIFASLRLVDKLGYSELAARRAVYDLLIASGVSLAPTRQCLAREWLYRFVSGDSTSCQVEGHA